MSNSDPRPMPPQVLAAYRDPLDLATLLASNVFDGRDRIAVRDKLLERLISKYGNVDVDVGKRGRTESLLQLVSLYRKNAWASIEIMLNIEEYGGREAVMLELATFMQPYWYRWWESLGRWSSFRSVEYSLRTAGTVIGDRQLAWLASQYARSVVPRARPSDITIVVSAIESAEAWAISPSENNRERARLAAISAKDLRFYSPNTAPQAAASAAYAAAGPDAVDATAMSALNAASASASGYDEAYSNFCELTKRLITPTLITSASRGLR